MKKLRIDLLAVLVLMAGTATAGSVWHYASCHRYADGSGHCSGTFKGFRDLAMDAGEKSYAEFNQSSDGSRSFAAVYPNPSSTDMVSAWCIPNAAVSAMWPQAMTTNGSFHISFDANGVCTQLHLSNGSAYYP